MLEDFHPERIGVLNGIYNFTQYFSGLKITKKLLVFLKDFLKSLGPHNRGLGGDWHLLCMDFGLLSQYIQGSPQKESLHFCQMGLHMGHFLVHDFTFDFVKAAWFPNLYFHRLQGL